MKTAMKKLFSLVLVAVLLIGVMPFQAFADETDVAQFEEMALLYDKFCVTCSIATFRPVTDHNDNDHCRACHRYPGHSADCPTLLCDDCHANPCICCDQCDGTTADHDDDCPTLLCDDCNANPCICCGQCDGTTADHDADCPTLLCDDCNANPCICCDQCDGTTADHDDDCPTLLCEVCHKNPCECNVMIATKAVLKQGSQETNRAENRQAGWSASVKDILIYWFNGDPEQFNNAYIYRTDKSAGPVGLNDFVNAGDEIHIRLKDTSVPASCATCGGALTEFGDCAACELDQLSCTCGQTATPEDNTGKVKLTLDYNYPGSTDSIQYVDRNSNLLNVIAGLPAPTRDGYLFDRWTLDERGNETIGRNDYVSNRGTTKIYAQWTKQVQVVNYGIDIHLNLNYDRKWGETVKSVAVGTRMGDVLDYVDEPVRRGYKFAGWYWDANCKNDVERNDRVQNSNKGYQTIYAKWVKKNYEHEVLLKIYLNGNTESAVKVIDLDAYVRDGKFTRYEASQIVSQYYEAKSSKDDMDVDGLFTSTTWNHGHYSMRNAEEVVHVNDKEDVVFFVMVRDAQRISSKTSVADSTNPKTGDMIFTPVIVLGASVSALAVLFYLNKKRAF